MLTSKDFEIIRNFLDEYSIYYETETYYDSNDFIIGHAIKINDTLESDDLTEDDIDFNSNWTDSSCELSYIL